MHSRVILECVLREGEFSDSHVFTQTFTQKSTRYDDRNLGGC